MSGKIEVRAGPPEPDSGFGSWIWVAGALGVIGVILFNVHPLTSQYGVHLNFLLAGMLLGYNVAMYQHMEDLDDDIEMLQHAMLLQATFIAAREVAEENGLVDEVDERGAKYREDLAEFLEVLRSDPDRSELEAARPGWLEEAREEHE